MPKSEIFRLNYFVGAVLAQGGNLWFDELKLVFSPTSAIDRALGATDVEIPFPKIQGVEFKGDFTRSFHIKTQDKLHRFHGSQAKSAWEALSKTLQGKGMKSQTQPKPKSNPAVCSQCAGHLEATFRFCPLCGTPVKSS